MLARPHRAPPAGAAAPGNRGPSSRKVAQDPCRHLHRGRAPATQSPSSSGGGKGEGGTNAVAVLGLPPRVASEEAVVLLVVVFDYVLPKSTPVDRDWNRIEPSTYFSKVHSHAALVANNVTYYMSIYI